MKKVLYVFLIVLLLTASFNFAIGENNGNVTTIIYDNLIHIEVPGKWKQTKDNEWFLNGMGDTSISFVCVNIENNYSSKVMEANRSNGADAIEQLLGESGYEKIDRIDAFYNINIKTYITRTQYETVYAEFAYFWADGKVYLLAYVDKSLDGYLDLKRVIESAEFIGTIKSRQMDVMVDDIRLTLKQGNEDVQEQNVSIEPIEPVEITFRGIEWGSTYNDVISSLSDWGMKFREGKSVKTRRIKSLINNSWSDYHDYQCGFYTYSSYSSEKKQVAGYDIDNVALYFSFVPDENGKLVQSPSNTSFFLGQYKIKPTDVDGVFVDLKNKLSSLYGQPAKETSNGLIIHYNYCYWYGANDTMVVIVSDDNWDCIYINYVWNKGDKLLDEADKILYQAEIDKEKEKFGLDNTDGL